MAQVLTDLGCRPESRGGKAAATAPPKPASGAGVASVYASAAPDGFIGWHPGSDVARSSTSPVTQPVNTASL